MATMTFKTGSLLHLGCLVVLLVMSYLLVYSTRKMRASGRKNFMRFFIGYGCIAVYILNTTYHVSAEVFSWEDGLPLHFCNWANLLGAAALLARIRTCQSLLYFWTLGMSIWAFLTPTLSAGPDDIDFWVFWAYHYFIIFALTFVLAIDKFRPERRDLKWAIVITGAYTLVLIVIDYAFNWNYGFLGPSSPSEPTPIDVLGAYPLRLIYLIVGVAIVFVLLLLPWELGKVLRRKSRKHNDAQGEGDD